MDILYLVDRLEKLIAGSRRVPLLNQVMVKEADILDIIETMHTAIPDEIKQARHVVQEKERILAQAQADASTLLAKAREESDKAMNREGLLHAAEERSAKMVREAEAQTEQMQNEADGYVAETLRALHEHLSTIQMDIDRSLISIEKGLSSLEEQSRGGQEEDMDEADEDGDDVYYEDDEGVGEPRAGQRGQAGQGSMPRRASLAVDTMGGPMYPPDMPQRLP